MFLLYTWADVVASQGLIVNEIPPFNLMKEHTRSAYYLVGLVLFFAIVGLVGCCNKRVPSCRCCNDTGDCCDCGGGHYYWWYSPYNSTSNDCCSCCCDCCCDCCSHTRGGGHHTVTGGGGGGGHRGGGGGGGGGSGDCDCGGGNCNGGGGGSDGGELMAVLAVVLIALIVIFALIGVMEGIFFISILMQRSMQRHVHMLQKASLAQQFVVEDLCGTVRFARAHSPHSLPSRCSRSQCVCRRRVVSRSLQALLAVREIDLWRLRRE